MISTDGAALLAGVLPVGLLVLVIELRRSVLELAVRFKSPTLRVIFAIGIIYAVAGSAASVVVCAWNVSAHTAINGPASMFVTISGLVLALAVTVPLGFSAEALAKAVISGQETNRDPEG